MNVFNMVVGFQVFMKCFNLMQTAPLHKFAVCYRSIKSQILKIYILIIDLYFRGLEVYSFPTYDL